MKHEVNCVVCGSLFLGSARNSKNCSVKCALERAKQLAKKRYEDKKEAKKTSIDIDPAGLCPKCHIDHEIAEKEAGRKLPVVESELCMECKTALGYVRAEGEDNMKRKKRKYTKRDEVALIKLGKKAEGAERAVKPGKKVRLGRETRKLIKGILKSGKKALKLEEKAEKSAKRGDTFYAKSKALREQAANMRAEIEALKDAVNGV